MPDDTPMMKQYLALKRRYPDAILFYRLGDFYEMFNEDAVLASKILGITLTSRNKSSDNPTPLCGVPHHSAESYVAKLIQEGHKVAICEQTEDPRFAKGVVERRVVRVLTPGVIIDSEKLDAKSGNFAASVYPLNGRIGIAYADISTGRFRATSLKNLEEAGEALSAIEPKEILLPEGLPELEAQITAGLMKPLVTKLDSWIWEAKRALGLLSEHFKLGSLDALGLEPYPEAAAACGGLLHYLIETQIDSLPPLDPPLFYESADYLIIDEASKRNLELIRPLRGDAKGGTLVSVLDETVTAMGGRMLRDWINYPLIDVAAIRERQDAVHEFHSKAAMRLKIRASLREISDIERLIGRISTSSARPRDLAALRDSVSRISETRRALKTAESKSAAHIYAGVDELADVREFLLKAIADEPPISQRDAGIVKEGFSPELDGLRSIKKDGRRWIAELEAAERRRAGINSLKVGYNQIFGYYIEVTKPNLSLVPGNYIRKQTIATGERFITPELKAQEETILKADERILELESGLFEEIRKTVARESERVRRTAALIARLDALMSLAEVAERYGYTKPAVDNSGDIELRDSRHPVVERMDLPERFVPNDIRLDKSENQFLIITGPNMAGKSTLIRQAALIVLMAQVGSFIPAKSAKIGVVDRIFTRVGASDNISKGQSTFMVEMVETAYILRHATGRSLAVLDEIGRGTSTFDGVSIAWAVAEYLHDAGCRSLFATHYHELSELALSKSRVRNYNVYVKEDGERVIFLRKLIAGAASHSYGIQVAKLAGVPEKVLKSARRVLANLEKSQSGLAVSIRGKGQLALFNAKREEREADDAGDAALDEIRKLNPLSMSPLEALSKLIEIKGKLEGK
ncbi:MAG: DNA mismatch repair protein MutS [Deltaproteobacteria bacterium]